MKKEYIAIGEFCDYPNCTKSAYKHCVICNKIFCDDHKFNLIDYASWWGGANKDSVCNDCVRNSTNTLITELQQLTDLTEQVELNYNRIKKLAEPLSNIIQKKLEKLREERRKDALR